MAFDSIEWSYLFEVLKRLGFGPKFCRWVALLYDTPLAQVRVNNHVSRTFQLYRGTRQGCPLSPLLFALMLEPLAYWVRRDVISRGLRWSEEVEDKISLYADDVLIYLASPQSSLSRIFHIFTNFGKYAGYEINWSKSILYPLHGLPPHLTNDHPIKITTEGFMYLGIFITPDPQIFYDRNLLKPLNKLRSDVRHWRTLPLTLLGRAALFKMLALPRFLYILHNCPYPIPDTYFLAIEGEIRTLLWDGGTPRIALPKLNLGWYDGGIALPNIRLYYWASQLAVINQWIHYPYNNPSIHLEEYQTGKEGYLGALYSKPCGRRYIGPMAQTLDIWHKANKLGWAQKLTKATPLWYTQQLGQLCHFKGFDRWDAIGISVVGDLLHKGRILTFSELQTKYSLAPTEHFRYRQIHHALTTQISDITNIPEHSPLEDRLIIDPMPKKAISFTYRKLCNNLPNPFLNLREQWTADLGHLEEEDWQQALMSPREVAINHRFRLI